MEDGTIPFKNIQQFIIKMTIFFPFLHTVHITIHKQFWEKCEDTTAKSDTIFFLVLVQKGVPKGALSKGAL